MIIPSALWGHRRRRLSASGGWGGGALSRHSVCLCLDLGLLDSRSVSRCLLVRPCGLWCLLQHLRLTKTMIFPFFSVEHYYSFLFINLFFVTPCGLQVLDQGWNSCPLQWRCNILTKVTAYADRSHSIKRGLLLWRKVMTNLDSILKSKDIALPTKVCLVKAMVFPVVRYGCESWSMKKAERWRIDAFELWCGEDS